MRYILFLLLLCSLEVNGQMLRKPGENHAIPVQMGTGLPDAHLDTIRARVITDLISPAVISDEVQRLIKSQKADGTWPDINYKDVSRTGFQHSQHLNNMIVLARTLKKSGSPLYGDIGVKNAVTKALDYWLANDFICENWWWNEMGTPNLMINLMLIMDTDLTERQRSEGLRIAGRANLEASGARPGGDLIQIAGMRGKQALYQRNSEVLAKVISILASEIKVSGGRGLKPDLSFHHRTDNVISTLTYGTGFASTFAYWAAKIARTSYSLPEPAMQLLVDYYLDGICQSLIYGKYPDPGAGNREITRMGALRSVGTEIAENLLLASTYRKAELANIVAIRKGSIEPNLTKDYYFWHSHYYTHQRPDYYTSVRMHSNRASNMEQPHNEEGLKNHHYGDGSNFISRTGQEYNQIFPVWDWQKIPGTTVVQKPDVAPWKDLARQGRNDFTGGVTDKRYGAAAFDFESVHDPLKAKKAWFFFDKEFVSLGAGIHSSADYDVATTLNQCLLNGEVSVNRAGAKEILTKGKHELSNVNWVLHDRVGYFFAEPTALTLNNERRVGNWRSVSHQSWATTDTVGKNVFTLWLNHGMKPQKQSYQYIVVPGISESEVDSYYSKKHISILSNTENIQAVEHNELGIGQVVFYKPGKIELSGGMLISVDQPCMVMVSRSGLAIKKLTVSDPTGRLKKLKLDVNTRVIGNTPQWQTTWDEFRKVTTVTFNLPQEGRAGQSVIAISEN